MNGLKVNIEALESLPHILVVDDDERLRSLLNRYLSEQGFLVTTATDAADARSKMRSLAFDLLVLDIMMPGETGLELTQALRREGGQPVLLLTALGELQDRIAGLEAGADDYLAKPFEPRELLLRVNAILRRAPQTTAEGDEVKIGNYSFNAGKSLLLRGEDSTHLTQTETKLLKALAGARGKALSRETLAELCGIGDANLRSVDVQVTRLRKKIEEDPSNPRHLQTVRGEGYILHRD